MALYKEYEKLPRKERPPRKALIPLTVDQNNIAIEEGNDLQKPKSDASEGKPVVLKGEELKSLIEGYVKQAMKKELRALCGKFEALLDSGNL